MKSYLQQLENNEAILLMYLLDELPPQDRAEVEQMLASDAGLRNELQSLELAHCEFQTELKKADAGERLAISADVATRNVIRHMNRQKLLQAASSETVVRSSRGVPQWLYYSGAAAAIIVGFFVWWGTRPPDQVSTGGYHFATNWTPQPHELTDDEKIAMLNRSFYTSMLDDSEDVQLAVVASKSEDVDLNFDLPGDVDSSHGADGHE